MNPADQPNKDRQNIFLRLWRGELPLVVSYWVFGVLAGLVWRIAPRILNLSNRVEVALLWAAMVGYYFVAYVGIWRAANKYTGRKEWAFLAKAAVVVGSIFLISSLRSTP